MFISFECFTRRVLIMDGENYPKVYFRGVFAAISTSRVATKHSKGFILVVCLYFTISKAKSRMLLFTKG